MPRPPKALLDHVLEATFRPSRHGELLEHEPLPPKPPLRGAKPTVEGVWERLRGLQGEYAALEGRELRREVAEDFAAAVRDLTEARKTRFTLDELIYGGIGPSPTQWVGRGLPLDEYANVMAAWKAWNDEHGPAWRASRGCPKARRS